jgi:hypothetical protein
MEKGAALDKTLVLLVTTPHDAAAVGRRHKRKQVAGLCPRVQMEAAPLDAQHPAALCGPLRSCAVHPAFTSRQERRTGRRLYGHLCEKRSREWNSSLKGAP